MRIKGLKMLDFLIVICLAVLHSLLQSVAPILVCLLIFLSSYVSFCIFASIEEILTAPVRNPHMISYHWDYSSCHIIFFPFFKKLIFEYFQLLIDYFSIVVTLA